MVDNNNYIMLPIDLVTIKNYNKEWEPYNFDFLLKS